MDAFGIYKEQGKSSSMMDDQYVTRVADLNGYDDMVITCRQVKNQSVIESSLKKKLNLA